jgi:hypothetical protein
MVNVARSTRRQRRFEAISFIIDHMVAPDDHTVAPEEVTSEEVWNKGRSMLATGLKWPQQTKNSFKGFKGKESLANTMRMHPRLVRSHRTVSVARGRTRTTVFTVID